MLLLTLEKALQLFEWTSSFELNNCDMDTRILVFIPKQTAIYKAWLWSKEHDRSIKWDDKNININWPLKKTNCKLPKLSEKDANAPFLKNADIFN